jgi:aminoglycoside phosphotransferase (APT) family kinase protein
MDRSELAKEKILDIQQGKVVDVISIRKGVNDSYRVDTKNKKFFIKFGTEAGRRIQTEYRVYNMLYDRRGIPVPEPIYFGSSKNINFIITDWIDRNEKESSKSNNNKISRSMGEILARIHKLTVSPGPILLEENNNCNWEDFYTKWLKYNAEDVKKNYSDLGSELMECVHNVNIPNPDRFCISPIDYHLENCISSNKEVKAVIDFERSYGGDPRWSYEVSKRLMRISGVEESFILGYSKICNLDSHPAFKLGAICRELRMVHMLFESPESKRKTYREEIQNIKSEIFNS